MSGKLRRRATVVVLLAAISLLAAARSAQASSIINLYSFSGSTLDGMAVQPFDPSLGTLDSVNVSIIGGLSISGTTASNFVLNGTALVAVPYLYSVTVDQDFFGLGNKYFDFNQNSTFTFANNLALGFGEGFSFSTNFSYGFTFTETTDLFGFVIPSASSSAGTLFPPLFGVSGTRADFLQTIVPLDQIQMFQTWAGQPIGPLSPTITSVNTSGSMLITYNYTPFPPASVPEPASLSLVVLGLTGLGVMRYRRRSIARS